MTFASIVLLAQILTPGERASFEQAIALHLASDFEGALRGYEGTLGARPDFLPARLYRAEALWLLGRRDEARETLSRVQEELFLVRVLRRTFGESADPLAERVAEAYPLERNRFLATGTAALVLLSMGELEEAIADYRRIASIDPEDATLHRQLGGAFASAKLFSPAVEAFERVVVTDPGDASSWRQLGSGNLVLQRWEPAIDALEKVLGLAGEDAGLLLALGYTYERMPNIEKALDLYRRAARLAPDSGRPHYRIGRALMTQGKLEGAEKAFTKASSLDPKMPEPLGFLGEIQLRRGDTELALRTLESALAADPEYFEAYYHLAQVHRRLGRADEARAALVRYEELKRKKRGVLSQEEVLALR